MKLSWAEKVQAVADTRKAANQPVWDMISALNQTRDLPREEKNAYLGQLYAALSDKDVSQATVDQSAKFQVGTSFRSSMNNLRRIKARLRSFGISIFPGGNPKLKDRAFASSLGIPVPTTYAENVSIGEIELLPRTIVKPVKGSSSMGVFYIDDELRAYSMRSSKSYASFKEAGAEIRTYEAQISFDRWLVEEAILTDKGKPANDFKVYAFYGVAGMYLEIDRTTSGVAKYATYDQAGELIGLGPRQESFSGNGIPKDLSSYVEKMSLASPVPFLRFDFHHGHDGVYLGEITPHPGGTYAGQLYDSVDTMLGHHFADAEARLVLDLLNGKDFPEFHAAYGEVLPQ